MKTLKGGSENSEGWGREQGKVGFVEPWSVGREHGKIADK